MPTMTWTLVEDSLASAVAASSGEDQGARDFRLDALTKDLVVFPGMQLVRGLEGIAQNLYLRLSMFLGEWFLDTDDGTDWFGSVLGKQSRDLQLAKSVLRERILGTVGVLDLIELEFKVDAGARTLRATWKVMTDLGALSQTVEGTGV